LYAVESTQFTSPCLRPLALCVVIPTLNERLNILPLLKRLDASLIGIEWEAIFVDDGSTDGTPELVASLALEHRHVRLIRRVGRRGLSSAVIEGMLASVAPVLAVIDGDLQHDEAVLPSLFHAVHSSGADLAIGTRYGSGGSIGDWAPERVRLSGSATRLVRRLLHVELTDPMSGFFVISRGALMASVPRLSAIGYKILLDIITSAPAPLSVREIPYTFRPRNAGESKLDAAILMESLLLVLDKIVGRWLPLRFAMFLAVGALGVGVHLLALGLLVGVVGVSFARAQIAASLIAMTGNFFLNNRFTYRDRRLSGLPLARGLISFYMACGLGMVANVGIGSLIYGTDHRWWLAGVVGAAIGSVWNYALSSTLTWKRT
jgi:dolichol-phosphate mannosyltransferase